MTQWAYMRPYNTIKPVVASPTASFSQLLDGLEAVEDPAHVQNQVNQIIAKLQRRRRSLDSQALEYFVSMTGGMDNE